MANRVPLDTLHLWDKNPRTIKDKRFEALCKSLTDDPAFMELRPILATKDGRIYAGNMRYRAAQHLGWKDVPAILTDIPEKLANERAIKDNNEFGEWNNDELATLLDEMEKEGTDVSLLGLDDSIQKIIEQLNEAEIVEDEAPPVPQEAKTKPGDLYILGEHRLLCGDSTKIDDVERLMDGQKADMVHTDPPYNVDYEGSNGLKIENDHMGDSAFYTFLYDSFVNAYSVTKAGGAMYIYHADSEGLNFRKAYKESGFDLKQCIIWIKNSMVLGRQDYQWQHEPILYGWKPGEAHCWYGQFDKKTVIDDDVDLMKMGKPELIGMINKYRNGEFTTIIRESKPTRNDSHPTMKPINLCVNFILNSSQQAERVLDLFGGSGSTLIACEQLNRKCYMMELDPKYCDVIVSRWEKLTGSKAKLA